MQIALFGYGKMGKIIEQTAINRGHTIAQKFDSKSTNHNLANIDAAIDFSTPTTAIKNIKLCFNKGIPIISGTTGWLDNYDTAVNLCKEKDGSFLYASNFSLGVNIFFEVNKKLAQIMNTVDGYNLHIEEIHHTQKIDAPSGTAISLANGIIKNTNYQNWALDKTTDKEILIKAKRINEVPGTHEVCYNSAEDTISIKHTAHSREGFALGAVIAAEFIQGKKGVFTMKDVLKIG